MKNAKKRFDHWLEKARWKYGAKVALRQHQAKKVGTLKQVGERDVNGE